MALYVENIPVDFWLAHELLLLRNVDNYIGQLKNTHFHFMPRMRATAFNPNLPPQATVSYCTIEAITNRNGPRDTVLRMNKASLRVVDEWLAAEGYPPAGKTKPYPVPLSRTPHWEIFGDLPSRYFFARDRNRVATVDYRLQQITFAQLSSFPIVASPPSEIPAYIIIDQAMDDFTIFDSTGAKLFSQPLARILPHGNARQSTSRPYGYAAQRNAFGGAYGALAGAGTSNNSAGPPALTAADIIAYTNALAGQQFQNSYQSLSLRQYATRFYGFQEEKPAEPLPSAAPELGEILAWRVWRVRDPFEENGPYYPDMPKDAERRLRERSPFGLYSTHMSQTFWPTSGPLIADVKNDGHLQMDQSFGIHAWKTREAAEKYLQGEAGADAYLAIGQVALWGRVVEHELGYRAEFARVKEIAQVLSPQECYLRPVDSWHRSYLHGDRGGKSTRLPDSSMLARVRETYCLAEPREAVDSKAWTG